MFIIYLRSWLDAGGDVGFVVATGTFFVVSIELCNKKFSRLAVRALDTAQAFKLESFTMFSVLRR